VTGLAKPNLYLVETGEKISNSVRHYKYIVLNLLLIPFYNGLLNWVSFETHTPNIQVPTLSFCYCCLKKQTLKSVLIRALIFIKPYWTLVLCTFIRWCKIITTNTIRRKENRTQLWFFQNYWGSH